MHSHWRPWQSRSFPRAKSVSTEHRCALLFRFVESRWQCHWSTCCECFDPLHWIAGQCAIEHAYYCRSQFVPSCSWFLWREIACWVGLLSFRCCLCGRRFSVRQFAHGFSWPSHASQRSCLSHNLGQSSWKQGEFAKVQRKINLNRRLSLWSIVSALLVSRMTGSKVDRARPRQACRWDS